MTNGMLKWEYRVLAVGSYWSGVKDVELEATLNEWGEQGWEVVGFHPVEGSMKARIVAKRPLTRETQRQRSMPRINV